MVADTWVVPVDSNRGRAEEAGEATGDHHRHTASSNNRCVCTRDAYFHPNPKEKMLGLYLCTSAEFMDHRLRFRLLFSFYVVRVLKLET